MSLTSQRASDVSFFFEPKSVAVVGATNNPLKFGHYLLLNIIDLGFKGKVYPVNLKADEVLGLKAYPRVDLIPDEVEVVAVIVPAPSVPQVMRDCAKKGVKGVVILSSGFREVGGEGIKFEREIVETAKKAGIRIVGPNTTGILNTSNGFTTSFVPLPKLRKGNVALVAQTGLFAAAAFWWILSAEPFCLSKVMGLGNKSDVDDSEALECLARDEDTEVIAIYMEGVKDGRKFLEAAKKTTKKKPVLILKSGRTDAGVKAAMSHTASLVVKDEIFDVACKKVGAIRVKDFEELMDLTKAFALQPLAKGNRIGIVSMTGAGCVMAADYSAEYGLKLAELSDETVKYIESYLPSWIKVKNPFDSEMLFESVGPEDCLRISLGGMLGDKNVDCAICVLPSSPMFAFDVEGPVKEIKEKYPDKPFTMNFIGSKDMVDLWTKQLEDISVPVYPSIERCVRALGALSKYSKITRALVSDS
ncbi:MAG: acetate--CoA ligase family protein [Candidatus Bathyarchaeota archaeon]|nr:acetate--CoA ligase family protein [Candidatus Bathyarchaeota archaeon]